MSNLLIPAAGAVAGFMVGGPTGAQIGWMVGSAASAGQQEIKQDTIGDLRVQTAAYGTSIPYVIGRQRVSGNIIWSAEKSTYEIKERQGKGSGPTTVSTGYKISMLIGICAGPILGISRVWADGNLIIDSRDATKPLIGQLYLGDMSQVADPTYQAAVTDAPAYRGLAYISLTNFDLGVSGRVPQFSFEVVKGAAL